MQMLKMTERIKSQEEMDDIRRLVSKYFADKAQAEVDRLWDLGVINEEVIEQWKHEHMRTPLPSLWQVDGARSGGFAIRPPEYKDL